MVSDCNADVRPWRLILFCQALLSLRLGAIVAQPFGEKGITNPRSECIAFFAPSRLREGGNNQLAERGWQRIAWGGAGSPHGQPAWGAVASATSGTPGEGLKFSKPAVA